MPKIAICYFGLTRSIRYVYQSHYDNLFNVIKENGGEYDVFLHTWKTETDIIWDKQNFIPIDYNEYNYYNPISYKIDIEEEYLKDINFGDYYYEHEKDTEWLPMLIQNNLCSLESKKRCYEMCVNSNIKYDYIIFLRPDILFHFKLPYKEIFDKNNFEKKTVIALDTDKYEGYSNKFVITSFENAKYYGNQINELSDFRKKYGRFVTEKYTKYIMEKYYIVRTVHFLCNVVRPDGSIVA